MSDPPVIQVISLAQHTRVDLKVWNATDTDLREIDIGSWYGPEFGDHLCLRLHRRPKLR